MNVKRVSPREASALLADGWRYVDVRSVPEYEAGHPAGAFNIPLLHFTPGRGMSPNPNFAEAFSAHFQKDDKVVVGCKSGGRSLRAAQMLAEMGFLSVVDMRGGFLGEGDMTGRVVEPGWEACGLPVEKDPAPAGRAWADLGKKSG